MKAFLSGQADLAAVFDGNTIYAFSSETPEELLPCQPWEVSRLFGSVTDLVELRNTTHAEVAATLEQAWQKDRAYNLALILLDKLAETETRRLAAECLEEMFLVGDIVNFVGNILFACSLPAEADLVGAVRFAKVYSTSRLLDFLHELGQRQIQWTALGELATYGQPYASSKRRTRPTLSARRAMNWIRSHISRGSGID